MQSIDWDKVPLGTVPDRELARQLGCGATTVRRQRQNRSIPPAPTSTTRSSVPLPSKQEKKPEKPIDVEPVFRHAALKIFTEGLPADQQPTEKTAMTQITVSMERLLKRSLSAMALYNGGQADLCRDIRSVLNWLDEVQNPEKLNENRREAARMALLAS